MLYRNEFELETFLKMSTLKWDVSQPLKMFITREIIHKLRRYQTELWIPPFKCDMSQPSSMFIAGEIIEMLIVNFFLKHPVVFRSPSSSITRPGKKNFFFEMYNRGAWVQPFAK